jgi:hypothetical protein
VSAQFHSRSAVKAGADRDPFERASVRQVTAFVSRPRILLTLPFAVALVAAAPPVAAQGAGRDAGQPPLSVCTYDECGLRVEPGGLFRTPVLLRGARGQHVAGFGRLGPDLPRIVAGADSAVAHARAFRPLQRRAGVAGLLAGAAAVTAIALDAASDANDSAPFSIGAAVLGVYAGFETRRAVRELSRAVWWYNRALPR